MDFVVQDHTAIIRYQFATNTGEFLMCGRCGIYVGAQIEEGGRYYAIANLRTIGGRDALGRKGEAIDYSREDSTARRARRVSRWTPVGVPA